MPALPNESLALTRLLFLMKKCHASLSDSLIELETARLEGDPPPLEMALHLIGAHLHILEDFMNDYLVDFTDHITKIEEYNRD